MYLLAILLGLVAGLIAQPQQPIQAYTVSGNIYFYNYDNALNGIRFARIIVYELNGNAKTEVCRTYTNYAGLFSCRFNWNEVDGPDIQYSVFATDDRSVYIVDNNTINREVATYRQSSVVVTNYQYPELDFGTVSIPKESETNTAFLIYSQIAYTARHYLTNYWGWTNNFNDLGVHWNIENVDGSFYSDENYLITIDRSHRKEPDIILHEYGHYVVHKLYGTAYFVAKPCSWAMELRSQCGFAEGFPTYMQAVIQGEQDYVGTFDGQLVIRNLELPDPYTTGPMAAGAGAAFMYDIHDTDNRERCDRFGDYRLVWNAVKNNLPESTGEVYTWVRAENPAREADIDRIADNHSLTQASCNNALWVDTTVYLPAVTR